MQLSLETPSDLLKGLQILRSVGEAIPAGGILKAVAGIGIVVLETAETIRANKKECSDIAKRAAQDILMLTSQLTSNSDKDAPLSDDLRDRLEGYLQVLQEVSLTVTRLSTESRLKRTLRSASIQEDAKDCLNKLNEAYQAYVLQFSIATDTKLTALVREMRSLNSKLELTIAMNRDEPDEA
ncbi:hypothetical protein SISNIDRAFT_489320 [Sistotremastrum niveocremeum HHB9708]|uniref:Mixed lineage kinase domain-containing protein n=1 Tax=Sistotremastrum niveocremeum HHB9708 TaxID=1314777 RepID=A0A164Q627_9AGAM|nr:hypothetical protein SISNIDRAFT_489320 [Sistotremastrum niveocremeum HHB9708]